MNPASPVLPPLLSRPAGASLSVLMAGLFGAAELIARVCLIPAPVKVNHPCDMTWLIVLGGLAFLAVATPLLAIAVALLATRRWGVATAILATPVVGAVLLGAVLGRPDGGLYVAMVPGSIIALSSPLIVLCIRAARRADLEANDELLAGSAAWFTAVQIFTWGMFGLGLGLPVFGIVLGGGAMTLAIARLVGRRHWTAHVLRGDVAGLRAVRLDERPASLPCLFRRSGAEAWLVIERVPAPPSNPYRALPSLSHEAIAVVPAR